MLWLTLGLAFFVTNIGLDQGVPPASFESVNVCERVTGEAVAKAVGGQLLEARPVNVKGFASARCVYRVTVSGTPRAFVLWFEPPDDFQGLIDAQDHPPKPIEGVGDAAHLAYHADDKRYEIIAVKRGAVTLQVTGEQVDWIRAIALLALSKS